MSTPLISRFIESMTMTRERWHDGAGYDLQLLDEATEAEREQIENLLRSRGIKDWRDVEALVTLGTSPAREIVMNTYESGDAKTRAMILSRASAWFVETERTEAIVAALLDESATDELVGVMLEVEEHHPPQVIEALLLGVRNRDGVTAGEFAMMLLFLHGKAGSPWDMAPRPFILRFQDEEREPLFLELCEQIGANPDSIS